MGKTAGNDLDSAVLVNLVDVVVDIVVDGFCSPAQALGPNGFSRAWSSILPGWRACLILPHSQMLEDLANYRRLFDNGDDVHPATAFGTNQWGYKIDFFDEPSPGASGRFAPGSVWGIPGGSME